MNRIEHRKLVRARVAANNKKLRAMLGLPKALMQFCKRSGADAQSVMTMRLKYPF